MLFPEPETKDTNGIFSYGIGLGIAIILSLIFKGIKSVWRPQENDTIKDYGEQLTRCTTLLEVYGNKIADIEKELSKQRDDQKDVLIQITEKLTRLNTLLDEHEKKEQQNAKENS